jgi:hypothetical protein
MSKLDDIFEQLDQGYSVTAALDAKYEIKSLITEIIDEAYKTVDKSHIEALGEYYDKLFKEIREL